MEWLTKAMDIFSQVLSTVQSAITDVTGMLQPLMSMASSLPSMGKGQ